MSNTNIDTLSTFNAFVRSDIESSHAAIGGVLYVDSSALGNSGGGEDILASYSVPGNTLSVNNQSIWFEAWGTVASTANSKLLYVRFGSAGTNLIITYSIPTGLIVDWMLRGRIIRTGAATQIASIMLTDSTGGSYASGITTLNQTLSGAVTLSVSGTSGGSASNDIICEGFIVGWDNANS